MSHIDPTYSTSDFSRKSGDIIADALRRPVVITQRNKPRLVLLNIEDYQQLKSRTDTRQARTVEDFPDELLDEIETAIETYAEDDETGR